MKPQRFFITGTDTEVGKTVLTCALIHAFNESGFSTSALKPIAAGCEASNGELKNSDALALMQAASIKQSYGLVNPLALRYPCSPHIAAREDGVDINVADLMKQCEPPAQSDVCLIEGAGGWFVPINQEETMADFVKAMNIPVILVVGMRLGCLNHACLTAHAIRSAGLELAGWIANCIDPAMAFRQDNIDWLSQRMTASRLGVIPYQLNTPAQKLVQYLSVRSLVDRVRANSLATRK